MFKYDPQQAGPQYLEDLATGYWFSEVLFNAVEMEIFTHLELEGKNINKLADLLNCDLQGIERFCQALCTMGLLTQHEETLYNTQISSEFLVKDKEDYQGDSILWRKYLNSYWSDLKQCIKAGGRVNFESSPEDSKILAQRIKKYIKAMDNIARAKVKEIIPFFKGISLKGNILDVGAGSGAISAGFLEEFPDIKATLMDIPEVLNYTKELMEQRGLEANYCSANILEAWPVKEGQYDLVILSNIVHAYSEGEISFILAQAVKSLKHNGYVIVHDFFLEHESKKAALMDLNMFINTYNGKVFSGKWVRDELQSHNLHITELIPLKSDTALLIASKVKENLEKISLEATTSLISRLKALGFKGVYPIPTESVHVADWTYQRCQYGCENFGKSHCPPNSPSPEKTRETLKDYSQVLLLEGEPPSRDFQNLVLEAEKEAFLAGFYKAFAYWAGPCSICSSCTAEDNCQRTKDSRPSMEGAGIDVFETSKRAGISLRTLKEQREYVKYFGLLLLE